MGIFSGKHKKLKIVIAAIIAVVCAIALEIFLVSSFFIKVCTGDFGKDLPKPEVSHAEFPFEVVYEINGQKSVVKDTLIIEFCGTGWDEGQGKYYDWNVTTKDSDRVIYEIRDSGYETNIVVTGGDEVRLCLGTPEYYMGLEDVSTGETGGRYVFKAGDIRIHPNSDNKVEAISDEDLYEKYGIKIIKKNISSPLTEHNK